MFMRENIKQKFSGFTTIELLIVIVAIVILGTLIVITHNGVSQKNRDNDRRQDIVKLDGQIEAYQAETDKYPSLAQMNNPSFRNTNMKSLQQSDLTDPKWKSSNNHCTNGGQAVLQGSSTPSLGCYGYEPSPAGCDNKNTDCTGYLLTANLEIGGTYTKGSIN